VLPDVEYVSALGHALPVSHARVPSLLRERFLRPLGR
jgi:hypothetical protein